MARNVTYSVSPRINPRDKEAAPKYYAHVQANGDTDIREMSERIQQTCTVHKSDVYAVLVAMEDVITDALKNGEIVRLGDLGSLQIGISSKGAETEDDYTESLIRKTRINFRPGSALVGILTTLTFAKVKPRSTKADKEKPEAGEEEGGEDLTS
jgi:predicted histone-like DNA-binding protein